MYYPILKIWKKQKNRADADALVNQIMKLYLMWIIPYCKLCFPREDHRDHILPIIVIHFSVDPSIFDAL